MTPEEADTPEVVMEKEQSEMVATMWKPRGFIFIYEHIYNISWELSEIIGEHVIEDWNIATASCKLK